MFTHPLSLMDIDSDAYYSLSHLRQLISLYTYGMYVKHYLHVWRLWTPQVCTVYGDSGHLKSVLDISYCTVYRKNKSEYLFLRGEKQNNWCDQRS